MGPKTELKEILKNSSLEQNDKNLWDTFIDYAPANQLIAIIDAIRSLPDSLTFLNENLKEKIKAISEENKEAFSKIVEKEEKYLSGLE